MGVCRIPRPAAYRKPFIYWWGDSITAATAATGDYSTQIPQAQHIFFGYGGKKSYEIIANWSANLAIYPNLPNEMHILFLGSNNAYEPELIMADIATMAARIKSSNFLVLNPINGDYAENRAPNGANYHYYPELHDSQLALYGSRFVPIREILVAAYDSGSPADVEAHGWDIEPPSLRTDAIHPNAAGTHIIVGAVKAALAANWPQWFS